MDFDGGVTENEVVDGGRGGNEKGTGCHCRKDHRDRWPRRRYEDGGFSGERRKNTKCKPFCCSNSLSLLYSVILVVAVAVVVVLTVLIEVDVFSLLLYNCHWNMSDLSDFRSLVRSKLKSVGKRNDNQAWKWWCEGP